MNRGEVWEISPARKRGPAARVALLSWDSAYDIRERVTVAPITGTVRGLDTEVVLDGPDGVGGPCAINLDAITTVPRDTLVRRVAQLSDKRLEEVSHAIHIALGLPLAAEAL